MFYYDFIESLGNFIDYCILSRDSVSNDEECPDVRINAWFGPSGTVSPLHFDPNFNILCQVIGTKYVRIYSPEFSEFLYPYESNSMLCNTSQIADIKDSRTHQRFPKFSKAPYWECIINGKGSTILFCFHFSLRVEGEALLIPPKFWHYVESLSISFSVSFWW